MLTDFSFKNYMSFKDKTDFTMEANYDKSHERNLINFGNKKYSKVKIMYGANASGKSSFINAFSFVNQFVTVSNMMLNIANIAVKPYGFRQNANSYPSDFTIEFVKNDLKYSYSFSCDRKKVIEEKLEIYYSAKPTTIFNRVNTNEYEINKDIKNLSKFKELTAENKLFLITLATWNTEIVRPVVEFLINDLIILENTNVNFDYKSIIDNNEYDEFKSFCLRFLNNADINIYNFDLEVKKFEELDKFNMEALLRVNKEPSQIELLKNANFVNVNTIHQIKNNDSVEYYKLNMKDESLGTKQLFNLAPFLFYVFKEGKTLIVDEIDKSLHPILVESIIKMFLDESVNKNNAQLICNTHDTNLMNLNILRRDEICFVQKNYKNGVSEIYSLSDFSVRTTENAERAYMLGRYGAVPFVKGGFDA